MSVQPWGIKPTPLIPKTVLKCIGHLEAPNVYKELLGEGATLNVVANSLWSKVNAASEEYLNALVDFLKKNKRLYDSQFIYTGDVNTIGFHLLPFSTRTSNVVGAETNKFLHQDLTFRDALKLPRFGVRSVIEYACLIEAAFEYGVIGDQPIESETTNKPREIVNPDIEAFFRLLAAWTLGEKGEQDLTGSLPCPLEEWPKELIELYEKISNIETATLAGDLYESYSVPILIDRAFSFIDERLRDIAEKRIFPIRKNMTLEELGEDLEVTRERVRQLEKKAFDKLEIFKVQPYLPVKRRSDKLREMLGAAIPETKTEFVDALDALTQDFDVPEQKKFARGLLLWLAGPYYSKDGWIVNDKRLKEASFEALMSVSGDMGFISQQEYSEVLEKLGIKIEHHLNWMESLGHFVAIGEGYILFQGSILDKAEALLRYFDKPISDEQLMRFIGSESIRSFRQRLIDDQRFWRINRQNDFVLAGKEGYDEYTGITDEIVQELEANGGKALFSHLVDKVSSTYGVKENSVALYLNTPMFEKDEHGFVRIASPDEIKSIKTDIFRASACYLLDDGTWLWRVQVDENLLRGSGLLIPNAFAQKLGCDLGDKVVIQTSCGPISLGWSLSSTTGAHIGSLRQAALVHNLQKGDYLFVIATLPETTFAGLSESELNGAKSNLSRLCLLLGRKTTAIDEEALVEIASALGIVADSNTELLTASRRSLLAKGERGLADLLERPKMSVDDYINDMGKLFG